MTLPKISVVVTANTAQGEAGLDRLAQAAGRTEAAVDTAGNAAQRMGTRMNVAGQRSARFAGGIQNAAFQVEDFAVQVFAGTSAIRAMSMQLPQLLGGFGVFGAVAGAAFAILVPLAAKLFEGADAASDFEKELNELSPTLGSIRSGLSQLADIQQRYTDAINASGGASSGAAALVAANSRREFDARKQVLDVELQLLRIRTQERRDALRNLENQQEIARQNARLRAETLLGTTIPGEGTLGMPRVAPTREDILGAAGVDQDAMRNRRLSIQQIRAELELLDIAAGEAREALDTVFQDVGGAVGAAGGAAGGGRTPLEDTIERQKQALQSLRDQGRATWGALGDFIQQFAGRSKGAAIAALAIQKSLSIAQVLVNSKAAAVRALAELGPIAGPPVAARMLAFGKIQAGLIAATGLAQAAGGGGGSGGGSAGGGQGVTTSATPQVLDVNLAVRGGDALTDPAAISRFTDLLIDEFTDRGLPVRVSI